jgi:hypothetical protein
LPSSEILQNERNKVGEKNNMSNKLSDRKDLLKYWNYCRYPDLDSSTINLGSKKKYEWKCDKVDDHIFEKSPSNFSKIRIEKYKLIVGLSEFNINYTKSINKLRD